MTSFNVNCSLPSTQVNYVSGANVRGTLDILWSSLSIIILCTWSIQHLNVPIQSRPETRRQKICQKLLFFERKVRWMVINVFGPEFSLAKASSDLAAAKLVTPELISFAKQDNVDWTLAHSFYASMGGFAIRFPDDSQEKAEESKEENDDKHAAAVDDGSTDVRNSFHSSHSCSDEENQLQQTQSTNSSSAGQASRQISSEREAGPAETKTESNNNDEKSKVQDIKTMTTKMGVTVNITNMPRHLQYLVFTPFWGGLDAYPRLTEALKPWIGHIDWKVDRENHKTVMNLLESVTHANLEGRKIVWFYNIIPLRGNVWVPDGSQLLYARKHGIIDRLPSLPTERLEDLSKTSTMLKLITLGQIVWLILQLIVRKTENLPSIPLEIAVLAYAVLSLVTYTTLWSKPQDIQTCFYATAVRRPSQSEVDDIGKLGSMAIAVLRSHPWIPSNCLQMNGWSGRMFVAGLVLATFIFGGVHCLAWNSHFPTVTERLLWRIASIYITTSIIPSGLLGILFNGLQRISKTFKKSRTGGIFDLQEVTFSAFATLNTVGYIICRLYLTVEIFRSLFYSPPDAFVDTSWPSYLPHLM